MTFQKDDEDDTVMIDKGGDNIFAHTYIDVEDED